MTFMDPITKLSTCTNSTFLLETYTQAKLTEFPDPGTHSVLLVCYGFAQAFHITWDAQAKNLTPS